MLLLGMFSVRLPTVNFLYSGFTGCEHGFAYLDPSAGLVISITEILMVLFYHENVFRETVNRMKLAM